MEMTTRPLFALYVMWHPSIGKAGKLRIGFAGTLAAISIGASGRSAE